MRTSLFSNKFTHIPSQITLDGEQYLIVFRSTLSLIQQRDDDDDDDYYHYTALVSNFEQSLFIAYKSHHIMNISQIIY